MENLSINHYKEFKAQAKIYKYVHIMCWQACSKGNVWYISALSKDNILLKPK